MRRHLIHFMAKEELFCNPLMGWFLRYVHTFPVHRGHIDRKAVIESFRVLKNGEVLGIFPEGKRTRGGKVGPFHEGFAGIAIKAGVPVLPAAIVNSEFCRKNRSRPGHLWKTRAGTGRKGIGSRFSQRFFRQIRDIIIAMQISIKGILNESNSRCGLWLLLWRTPGCRAGRQGGKGTHTLGPIIHNPQVVGRLAAHGVSPVDSLDEVDKGAVVLIRSHGVGPDVYDQAVQKELKVIDATCPHVKKPNKTLKISSKRAKIS